jgi:hypothetical protein
MEVEGNRSDALPDVEGEIDARGEVGVEVEVEMREETTLVDECIDASENNGNIVKLYTFALAMVSRVVSEWTSELGHLIVVLQGNAADAVEIICVGYIMNEMDDDISTQDKGQYLFPDINATCTYDYTGTEM